MEDKQVERLFAKFDLILKPLAIDKLLGTKPVEQVALLTELGFQPSEIAIVLARKPTETTPILAKVKTIEFEQS